MRGPLCSQDGTVCYTHMPHPKAALKPGTNASELAFFWDWVEIFLGGGVATHSTCLHHKGGAYQNSRVSPKVPSVFLWFRPLSLLSYGSSGLVWDVHF